MPRNKARPKQDKHPIRNRLLAGLPRPDLQRLLPKLERVSLGLKQVLYEPNKPIDHVYFVEDGVVSLISPLEDGLIVEVGTVGNEGFVGMPVFFGTSATPLRAFSQVPGHAWKLSAAEFQREIQNGHALHNAISRYAQALFTQLAQSVACNRRHSLEQRCARWLLITQDRVGGNRFQLTQEFLAQMLGVRRASANVVLQQFQRSGMLRYRLGQMEITNRRKLKATACECYDVIRKEYQRLQVPLNS